MILLFPRRAEKNDQRLSPSTQVRVEKLLEHGGLSSVFLPLDLSRFV